MLYTPPPPSLFQVAKLEEDEGELQGKVHKWQEAYKRLEEDSITR